ncbi:hypothetical protein POTOM_039298 [Populus tomentosa]|uniref:Uncharacterized protein n=1 Tax=Populus tomentosa TaxID=118781 RepID=A0A8X7Z321_POPTO|nr:hypothetical protein POTOM_039298 [Populus tomentosa]
MVLPNENDNWVFDCGLIEDISVPGGDLLGLESLDETPNGSLWSSHNFTDSAFLSLVVVLFRNVGLTCEISKLCCLETLNCVAYWRGRLEVTTFPSVEFNNSYENSDGHKESGCRKRFMELGALLDPGRPPKVEKSAILVDAARMVTQLRDESQKLKESNVSLQEKIDELKAEKNELRDEKQRLKTEKENLERQVKALSTPPNFLPHPPAIPAPFSAPGQVVGSKLMPFVGYPGISMWQFMPPAVVDTSQDHVLRPPVA